jgi:hypothetical protein
VATQAARRPRPPVQGRHGSGGAMAHHGGHADRRVAVEGLADNGRALGECNSGDGERERGESEGWEIPQTGEGRRGEWVRGRARPGDRRGARQCSNDGDRRNSAPRDPTCPPLARHQGNSSEGGSGRAGAVVGDCGTRTRHRRLVRHWLGYCATSMGESWWHRAWPFGQSRVDRLPDRRLRWLQPELRSPRLDFSLGRTTEPG